MFSYVRSGLKVREILMNNTFDEYILIEIGIINWNNQRSTIGVENKFIETLQDNYLIQLI